MTLTHTPSQDDQISQEIAHLKARIAELEALQAARAKSKIPSKSPPTPTEEAAVIAERGELLQAILKNAANIAQTAHGQLHLLSADEQYMMAEAGIGLFRDFLGWTISQDYPGLVSWVWRSSHMQKVENYDEWEGRLQRMNAGIVYTVAGFPLKMEDKVIGVITLAYHEKGRRFDDTTLDLLDSFSRVAAAALENEHIYRELKQNRFFLESIVQTSPAIISLFDWRAGRCLFMNDTVKEMLGYSVAQALDVDNYRIFNLIHPDHHDAFIQSHQQAHPPNAILEYVYRFRHANGEWRWLRSRERAYKQDEQGRLIQTIGITQDITEYIKAEEQLRQNEAHARMLSEISTEFVFCVEINADGEMPVEEGSNRFKTLWRMGKTFAELTGYTQEELDFMTLDAVYHPDDYARLKADQKRVVKNRPVIGEYRIIKKDGEIRWLRTSRYPIWDEAQRCVVRFYGVVRDITEEKQAEDRKMALAVEKERVRLMAEFITNASHDFRTPLSTINTSIYLIERNYTSHENVQKHVQMVKTQTEHLNKLVDALLRMSRLDGMTRLYLHPTSINRFLNETSHAFQERARQRGQRIQYYLSDHLPPVLLNPVEMQTALLEIIENAMLYSPENATIVIYTEQVADEVVVAVCDNGDGIPAADLPHVFERFYRVDKARQSGHTGLGLSIAHRVMELQGGYLHIESKYGQGTSVFLHLPAAPDTEVPRSYANGHI